MFVLEVEGNKTQLSSAFLQTGAYQWLLRLLTQKKTHQNLQEHLMETSILVSQPKHLDYPPRENT